MKHIKIASNPNPDVKLSSGSPAIHTAPARVAQPTELRMLIMIVCLTKAKIQNNRTSAKYRTNEIVGDNNKTIVFALAKVDCNSIV